MKSALWVIAAGVAVTASAFAWRTTPKTIDAPLIAVTDTVKPIRHHAQTPSWSAILRPHEAAKNPVFQPLPALPTADEPVLSQLPGDTLFVAASDNLNTAMESIDLRGLLEQNATTLSELEKVLGAIPDVDPFNPATWSASGLQLDGPAGFAFVDFEHPVLVMFADVADRDALNRSMDALFAANDDATASRDVEGVTIVTKATDDGEPVDDPEVAFVLRGGRVFVVARMDSGSDVAARAEEIALQTAPGSLIEDPGVVGLVNALELGKDGVAYLNVRAMLAGESASIDRSISEREKELEDQRAANPTDENASWAEGRIKELEGARTMLEATVGSVAGVAFGVDLGQGQVEVEATVALEPGSLLQELMSTRSGGSPLRMALPTAPLFLMDGALSPSVVRRLVQLGFTMADADYAQVMQVAKAFGGFEKDPFDLITGEVGFGLTRREPGEAPDYMPINITVVAGLTDAVLAQKILDQIGGMATLAGWGKYVPETKGLALDGGFSANFAVVGRTAVFSTSGEIVKQFARGGRDVAAQVTLPAIAALLPRAGQTFNWVMDAAMFSLDDAFPQPDAYDPWPINDGDSAEVRGLKNELRKLDAQLYSEPQRRRAEIGKRLTTALGNWGVTATPDDVGLRVRGGWYFSADNVAEVLATVSDCNMQREDTWKTDEGLSAKREGLVTRLNALLAPPTEPSMVDPTYNEYPNAMLIPPPDLDYPRDITTGESEPISLPETAVDQIPNEPNDIPMDGIPMAPEIELNFDGNAPNAVGGPDQAGSPTTLEADSIYY